MEENIKLKNAAYQSAEFKVSWEEFQKKLKEFPYKKGDLVFDCFTGSGTTAISCKELERHFLGCEINPDYVKIIRKRLSQTLVGDFNPPTEESLISVTLSKIQKIGGQDGKM